MKIHSLNGATLCPKAGPMIGLPKNKNGESEMVCRVLLIELNNQLVMVDAALSTADIEEPKKRLGQAFLSLVGPKLFHAETILEQIKAMGFSPKDVQHILVTHLDVDHAGGVADFPHAKIHVMSNEKLAVEQPSFREKLRYRPIIFSHTPHWEPYYLEEGEHWFGFQCVRQLRGLPPEILFVPLSGHTRGHAGVAINQGDQWILHAGDAFFQDIELTPEKNKIPQALRWFQRVDALDANQREYNLARLQQLHHSEKSVRIICSHDASTPPVSLHAPTP